MKFELNVPQLLTILDPLGDSEGSQVVYQSSAGELSLPRHAARKIDALKLAPGEEISICRYQRPGEPAAEWVIALSPKTEKARAAAEAPTLEAQLAETLKLTNRGTPLREIRPPAPAESSTPKISPRLAPKATREGASGRVGYREALREITGAVTGTLRDLGEQWSDQSRQDAVSTIFIAAAKAGMIAWNFEAPKEREVA